MKHVSLLPLPGRNLLVAVAASLLLAAYAPMASIAGAQAAGDSLKLQQLKQKAGQELDRRIANLEQTLKQLEVDVHLDNEGLQASASGKNGSASATVNKDGVNATAEGKNGSASLSAGQDGLNVAIEVTPQIKDKVKQLIQKFIEKLKSMKDRVENSSQLSDMQSLGKSIDSQFGLDQLTNVQGTVTKAIESLTSVFDKLKSTKDDLQSQITKLKDCAAGIKSGEGSIDINASDGNVNVKASAPGCDDLDINSSEIVDSAQSQLDNISTIMSTISSILASSIALVTSLISSVTGLMGGLGNLNSLGDVSNLSSLGNISGLLSSFTALTSQLGIAGDMAGSASGLLGNLSNFTSGFNF